MNPGALQPQSRAIQGNPLWSKLGKLAIAKNRLNISSSSSSG